jgi:flavin reductase (DIM6/NTAB) family NADH-FMN oxidoreductase RutF
MSDGDRLSTLEACMDFILIDGAGLDTAAGYRLIIGCVVPRPTAWITSLDAQGRVNAAPFSSYNYVATSPPMVAVNIASRAGSIKDTARNIRDTGEFVVNVATESNMELMHQCGDDYAPEVSETDVMGLELLPSHRVRAPRIALSPVQMECRLDQAIVLGRGVNTLFIGEVIAFHLSRTIYDGQRVDCAKMRPIARLGGPFYAALGGSSIDPCCNVPPEVKAGSGRNRIQPRTALRRANQRVARFSSLRAYSHTAPTLLPNGTHLAVSARIKAPSSSGEPPTAPAPCFASCSRRSEDVSAVAAA